MIGPFEVECTAEVDCSLLCRKFMLPVDGDVSLLEVCERITGSEIAHSVLVFGY